MAPTERIGGQSSTGSNKSEETERLFLTELYNVTLFPKHYKVGVSDTESLRRYIQGTGKVPVHVTRFINGKFPLVTPSLLLFEITRVWYVLLD